MNTIDFIRTSLAMTKDLAVSLIQDMRDAPLTTASASGNHPWWIAGHLAYSEAFLFDRAIMGRRNRYAQWRDLFGAKSTPHAAGDHYPEIPLLLAEWDAVRADALAHLETLAADDLDQRSRAPEEYGPRFATVGACYAMMIVHPQFHAGQVAEARRSLGRSPLFL